jgi:hypothetical protein
MEYILIAAGVVAVGSGFVGMTSYNRLMAMDSRCDKASADIDVQLKHRTGNNKRNQQSATKCDDSANG